MAEATQSKQQGGVRIESKLVQRHCRPIPPGTKPLEGNEISEMLGGLNGWTQEGARELHRTFKFPDYYQTIAFVNAVAWVANRENHHPDMEVGYNRCTIRYSTHDVDGLSENDFICAAHIDALFPRTEPQQYSI
jgi:4a-hydroxytetrahydrobiopterin dehydratase